MMYLFAIFPIKARVRKISYRCNNMNRPGPRENNEEIEVNAFRAVERAVKIIKA